MMYRSLVVRAGATPCGKLSDGLVAQPGDRAAGTERRGNGREELECAQS